MRRRQIKKEIFNLLQQSPLETIYKEIKLFPEVAVVNALFMAICDPNEMIRWRGVSCFGEVVASIEQEDIERSRVIMRRFLWSLNDESGGIGWGAPEAMAEVMLKSARLRKEYLHMLISYILEDGEGLFQDGNFLELPMLQRGLLWGIGRLCYSYPSEMGLKDVGKELEKYLDATDQEVRALALWAMAGLEIKLTDTSILREEGSATTLRLYLDGTFKEIPMDSICDKLFSQ